MSPDATSTDPTYWPTHLNHATGRYVLLRPGRTTSDSTGEVCLYAKLDANGMILRDMMYFGRSPGQAADMPPQVFLVGNPWLSDSAMAATGQSPVVIPSEPVAWP